ncbi:MAG: DUF2460 domain-containing protein [Alphaproteobacteria bacterium]|nr:DUF2460 domain-containing protein [Alphaproteobacteria bacterium]
MSFHDIRFPTEISMGAQGGPERRTEVVTLGSGYEERNSRWADSRRSFNAGYGVRSIDDLHAVINFFEERRGRLYGFRWRDHTDWKSCAPGEVVSPLDQVIGTGDGTKASFQLTKTYGAAFAPWTRQVTKPVAGSVMVAVDGVAQSEGDDFLADPLNGSIFFQPSSVPGNGAQITAGFEFDVPVRFDADQLEINLQGFHAGAIPSIPIVEIRL